MNDRVEALDILRREVAHVLRVGERTRLAIVIEPAVAVKAAIDADDIKPLRQQLRPEDGADIPVDASNEDAQLRHVCLVK